MAEATPSLALRRIGLNHSVRKNARFRTLAYGQPRTENGIPAMTDVAQTQ
jgi:hypothetical protein